MSHFHLDFVLVFMYLAHNFGTNTEINFRYIFTIIIYITFAKTYTIFKVLPLFHNDFVCLSIVIVRLIFKFHLFQMIRIVECAISSEAFVLNLLIK
jgi:hypothetical protein